MTPLPNSSPQHPENRKTEDCARNRGSLTIAVLNCRSIRSEARSNEFCTFVREHNPDVILGTESWLSTDINDAEIFPQDYVVYRKDRSERLGGGVFIAIRDTIVSYKEDWNCNGLCEAVWCRIVDKYNTHYLLGCFYDPPSDCSSALSEFLSVLERQAHINNSRIVVGGDFNLPYIDWEHMVSLTSGRYQKKNQILLNVLNNCGLEQLVKVPTRLSQNVGNIIDLVVANTPQRIQSIITCIVSATIQLL